VNHRQEKSLYSVKNIRQFIAFRVFFNARFYYPVFTILFLDFGLTLEQFALLNAAWAVTIVVLEVPSGALADIIGRRNLLVFAGSVMVLEMGILCLAPPGKVKFLFWIFLFNRILSGTAEAAASGADEALAYDSLKEQGFEGQWDFVLEKQMRAQSIAFILAMSIGAAVYDPDLISSLVRSAGLGIVIDQAITLKFPLYLTFLMAIMTLVSTLQMRETVYDSHNTNDRVPLGRAFKLTLQAGNWILKTPLAFIIILAGLFFDSITRLIITLESQYFRLIDIPEASFGLIGSGVAVLGLFMPRLARSMVEKCSIYVNFLILAIFVFIALLGMVPFISFWGLLPILFLSSSMFLLGFFLSHYLNIITSSEQRATILSFKGLALNLAYGLIGVLYSSLLAFLRKRNFQSDLINKASEDTIFKTSIAWLPWFFLAGLLILLVFVFWKMQRDNRTTCGMNDLLKH
jgi:MFS family permease